DCVSSVASAGPLLLFCHVAAPAQTSTLPLHDALPICPPARVTRGPPSSRRRLRPRPVTRSPRRGGARRRCAAGWPARRERDRRGDRKSTRLNSSHVKISYAVFCLKNKK